MPESTEKAASEGKEVECPWEWEEGSPGNRPAEAVLGAWDPFSAGCIALQSIANCEFGVLRPPNALHIWHLFAGALEYTQSHAR